MTQGKALQTNEIDAPTLAAGVASLTAQRRDSHRGDSAGAWEEAARSRRDALWQGGTEACVPLIDDVLGGSCKAGRIYGLSLPACLTREKTLRSVEGLGTG